MRTSFLRRGAAAVVLAGLAAAGTACSDDDAEDGDPPGSTTSAAAASSTTSTAPQAVELSLVVGRMGLLGWWDGSGWVQAEGGVPTPFSAGQEYALLRLDEPATTLRSTELTEPEEFCGTPQVEFEPAFPDNDELFDHSFPIAVHGVADPRPRPLTLLDTDAATYRDAAREVLSGLGIDDPEPELVQVVRADLSGDGTDEVLVVAERIADVGSLLGEPGDYSVLFVREVVDGEVRTTVVEQFHKDPATEEEPSPYIVVQRVSAIADLNGDSRMEVVLTDRYYEGTSMSMRELRPDGTLPEVIAAGCGV